MKTTSDHLFKLIKSLSGSEKRYFKRHSKLHIRSDQNNYSRLFNAIDLQKEYDEEKLLRKFGKEPLVNNFSVAKSYLYNAILESLNSYHTDSNSEIRSMLNKAEILNERELFSQAIKLLKKAKTLAILHEKLIYIYEISALELTIHRLGYGAEDMNNLYEEQIEEIDLCYLQIGNLRQYKNLRNRLISQSIQTGSIRDEKDIKKYEWLLKNPLMKKEERALSVNAKLLYYESYWRYYSLTRNLKKAYEISSLLSKLIEKNPKVLEDNIDHPTQFLWIHSIASHMVGEYNQALTYLSKLELLKPKSNSRKTNTLFKVYISKLNIYFSMGDTKKYLALISEIEPIIEKSKDADKILRQNLYRYISYLLFLAGEFKQSLKWIVKGNISDNYNTLQDLECIFRIMEIVIEYELDKFDIMESRIKSVERFLTSKHKLYPLEKSILVFLKKLVHINSKRESISFFKQFKTALQPLTKDPLGKNFLTYFDIISWIESKIENKKFDDIVRSKIKVLI